MFLAEGFGHSLRVFLSHLYGVAVTLGGPGLFFIAVADSSFLSVPEGNDFLIIVLSTGQSWQRMAYYVVMTILGSVTGCSLLYGVGQRGGHFVHRRVQRKRIEELEGMYRQWGIWAVVVPSIMPPPMPFKIFVLSAGFFRLPFLKFIMAVTLGRSIRYFTWGILAVVYGQLAKEFLERNVHTVGVLLFLLFVGAIVGYLLMWTRARRKSSQQETV